MFTKSASMLLQQCTAVYVPVARIKCWALSTEQIAFGHNKTVFPFERKKISAAFPLLVKKRL